MIEKITINDNTKSPVGWLPKLDNFANGKEYDFIDGVNIIVGDNGCGKTTLLELIKRYLLVDYTECSRGKYNCNINELFNGFTKDSGFKDGVGVYADYTLNTFRLCHAGEMIRDDIAESFESAALYMEHRSSSTGESVFIAMNSLFGKMFGKGARLTFDYEQFDGSKNYGEYYEYIKSHRVKKHKSITILMDEPDRNLSLDNIKQIDGILNYKKPNTQLIAVIHNPILIYSLSKNKDINFIEMTDGYVSKVKNMINELVK